MATSVGCLLHKHEHLNLKANLPCKNLTLSLTSITPCLRDRDGKIPDTHWLASQDDSISRFNVRLFFKK